MRFGTLIPHFGAHATRDTIVRMSARAEELGFESLWARDHLVWQPHGMEGSNKTFIDAFEALAAAAAVTATAVLGTAVTIPIRWPLKLAQEFAGLEFIANGRVEAGIGLGANPAEFAAAGLRAEDREQIFEESVAILRRAWEPGPITFHGDLFQIDGIELEPKPTAPIPILYGGTTPAAVRRAARLTDGWYCGRLPLATLDKRLTLLRSLEQGSRLRTVIQPLVVIDRDRERALERIPIWEVGHSSEGSKFWVKPPSGEFETIEDLEGLVVWGTPDDVVGQIQPFIERGVDDFVFDLRLQFDDYEAALELIGREVLPAVRTS